MAASTITRDAWTNDTGTAANPNADGTVLNNTVLQNNVYARVDAMFAGAGSYATLTLGGLLAVEGFGTHLFSSAGTGANVVRSRNTTAGTGNFGAVQVMADGSTVTQVDHFSSTFTTSGSAVASGGRIVADGVGGLSLTASNASGSLRFYAGSSSTESGRFTGTKFFLGDTSDANITIGMCINQGGAGYAMSFKGSGIAHALAAVETDTGGTLHVNTVTGGLYVHGYMEGANAAALSLNGNAATGAGDTTKSTAATGFIEIVATENAAGIGANENICIFKNGASTTHILDAEGDSHQDVGTAWTNFDDDDDIKRLDAIAVTLARDGDPLRGQFVSHFEQHRNVIEAMPGKPLVSFSEDGHHFVNMSRLSMLLTGAVRQLARQQAHLEARIAALPAHE